MSAGGPSSSSSVELRNPGPQLGQGTSRLPDCLQARRCDTKETFGASTARRSRVAKCGRDQAVGFEAVEGGIHGGKDDASPACVFELPRDGDAIGLVSDAEHREQDHQLEVGQIVAGQCSQSVNKSTWGVKPGRGILSAMKVAGRIAGVLLALLVALALVMFLWLLYPISAGVAVFLFLRTIWTNPKGKVAIFVRRFATVILLIYVLVFVVWLYYRPWSRELIAQPQSAGASTIAQAITGRSNDGAGSQDDPLAEPRRILTTRIADARFKLQEIASAIATIESAESILVSRTRTGQPDPFGLSSALEDVRSEMARVKPEGSTDSRGLLDPDVLRAVGESLTKELDEIRNRTDGRKSDQGGHRRVAEPDARVPESKRSGPSADQAC